jgi:hypothetical protein
MVYSTAYGHLIHRDCSNFVNGICRLKGSPVYPNGPACPRFTPKSTAKTIRAEKAYPRARRPYQIYPMREQGQPFGIRGGREVSMIEMMSRTRGMTAYLPNPPMRTQTPSTKVRVQEEEVLKHQLEELERQLNEVKRKLELRTRRLQSFSHTRSDC